MSQNNPKNKDLRKVKELGLSQEQINQFLNSNFDDIEEWNTANAAGFDEYTEWIDAKKGGFPTRADWILATYKGYKTYAEYKRLKKPLEKTEVTKSSSEMINQKLSDNKSISTPTPDLTNNKPLVPPTQRVPELKLKTDLEEPTSTNLPLKSQPEKIPDDLLKKTQSDILESQNATINSELVSNKSTSSMPELAPENYEQQNLRVEEPKKDSSQPVPAIRPSPPYIDPIKFLNNPQLERIYRFAEVLYETNQAKLDDLTAALNFEDLIDVEEWLGEILQSNQYFISLDRQIIIFQDEAYSFILNYLNNLHSLDEV